MCIICICSDNMWMTYTYANNSSRNEMYIPYASVDNIQMILTMYMCGDNMYGNSVVDNRVYKEC